MVDLLLAESACQHVGWALWKDWWSWYCANCGITVSEPDLINELNGHTIGELWRGNECVS